MKRINSGLYTEHRTVLVDGKPTEAEFQVFKLKSKNAKKDTTLPLWSWDCPGQKILPRDVYDSKKDAITALNRSCQIGFKNVSLNAVMLAL